AFPAPIVASGLFVLSLGVCMAFASHYPIPPPHDDAVEYLSLARNLAAGNGFSTDGISPAVYRPPLFSSLLGGWFFLTGTTSLASAAFFQSLLHAGGAVAAFFLFLELAPAAWALFGALFLALHPVLVTRVVFVLQEPTIILFTTLAALASLRLIRAPSGPKAALAGVAWGVCILAKSVAGFAPLLLVATRWLPASFRTGITRREGLMLLLAAALTLAPWTIRNEIRFGRFIPVNGQGSGILLWNIEHTEVTGDPERERLVSAIGQDGGESSETKERILRFVSRHPREFLLERTLLNIVHFASPPRDWWISRGLVHPGERPPLFWLLSLLFWLPPFAVLPFATMSAIGKRASPPALCFLILLYWGYWAEHALVWGDPRYGLAVYPVLMAIGLSTVARWRRP
ncbi:MAG TPA: hypothetical protein VIU29_05260, partial [Candidatus Deferrimicrobiaceae bacterium]